MSTVIKKKATKAPIPSGTIENSVPSEIRERAGKKYAYSGKYSGRLGIEYGEVVDRNLPPGERTASERLNHD